MKKLLLLLSIIILISSCSSTYYLTPKVSGNNLDTYYTNGVPVVVSQTENSTIYATIQKNGNIFDVSLEILNNSKEKRFDFIPEKNIQVLGNYCAPLTPIWVKLVLFPPWALFHKKTEENGNLKVYNPDKYLKAMKRKQKTALVLSAMASGGSNATKGTSTSTSNTNTKTNFSGNSNSNTSGFVGSSNVNLNTETDFKGKINSNSTTKTTTYDQSKVDEANWRSEQELKLAAQNYQNIYDETSNGLLRRVTLFPESKAQGIIKVKHNNCENFTLLITIGDELHEINYTK